MQCVEFVQPAERLISGDSQGHVRVWDLDTARSVVTDAHGSNAGVLQLQSLTQDLIASQGRDGEVKFWHLRQNGSLEGAGVLPSNGFHFCKCRAHACPSSPADSVESLPAQALTTYEADLRLFHTWDMRARAIAIETPHDKQYGTAMCVQISATASAPLLTCGCGMPAGLRSAMQCACTRR